MEPVSQVSLERDLERARQGTSTQHFPGILPPSSHTSALPTTSSTTPPRSLTAASGKRNFATAFLRNKYIENRIKRARQFVSRSSTPMSGSAAVIGRTLIPEIVTNNVMFTPRDPGGCHSLQWSSFVVMLENASVDDFRDRLLKLVRRVEEKQHADDWVAGFEHAVELIKRFESRTANDLKTLLRTSSESSETNLNALAKASTNLFVNRLIELRLEAISAEPLSRRVHVWRALLDGMAHSQACTKVSDLMPLIQYVDHLAVAAKPSAISALVETACHMGTHQKGWYELTFSLLRVSPQSEIAPMIRKLVDHGAESSVDKMKSILSAASQYFEDVLEQDFPALMTYLIGRVTDNTAISSEASLAMLDDLQDGMTRREYLDDDVADGVRHAISHAFDTHVKSLFERH